MAIPLVTIPRLSGGLTPADGGDPRTFPTIFNQIADLTETTAQEAANEFATLQGRVDVLEAASTAVNFYTVTKTDTFVWVAAPAGGGLDIPGLTIPLALTEPTNTLLILGMAGAATTDAVNNSIGLSVSDGSNLLGIGDIAGSRSRVTAGGPGQPSDGGSTSSVVQSLFISIAHQPGDLGPRTFRLRGINASASVRTIYFNRSQTDADTPFGVRSASAMHIMEIAS